MNYDPNDLYGVLPALILSAGALLLLTSEVFLRNVKPAVLVRRRDPRRRRSGSSRQIRRQAAGSSGAARSKVPGVGGRRVRGRGALGQRSPGWAIRRSRSSRARR